MNFASDYVLETEDVYEQVSDDEYEQGMSVSSDSDGEDGPPPALALKAASQTKKSLPRKKSHWKDSFTGRSGSKAADQEVTDGLNKRWFRQADTNVVSVKFDTLLSPGNMHAGDPIICAQCGAILSHISKLQSQDGVKTWSCEFCGTTVPVEMEEEETPGTEDVTYLLEPAMSTATSSLSGMDQSMVIFVVDTSGSMCVTTEVEGKLKLRGTSQLQRLSSFNLENEDQFLPSQKRHNVTYISRLQAMQAAVDHQLEEMSRQHSHRRVGLVAFNNEVTVIGDGTQTEVIFAGDKLTNQEQLQKEASDIHPSQPIRSSRMVLGEKVYKLEEGGATALGPALVIAVSMASQHPGSKVILCTDGKANIGLGKLEETQEEGAAMQFYGGVGEKALQAGVTISVITISGTDCKLVHLGQLADKTGGQVNIVDPLKLKEEFSNILADPIIATKVKATFILYKDLYIVNEQDPDKQECRAEQLVGNVYSSSTVTFQFAKRKTDGEALDGKNKKKKQRKSTVKQREEEGSGTGIQENTEGATAAPPPTPPSASSETAPADNFSSERKDLPFQLQIEYVDSEGNKALRAITRTMPTTTDRLLAEQKADLTILGAHAAKTSANLALKGKYSHSRGVALMNQRLAWRSCNSEVSTKESKTTYKNIFSKLKGLENRLGRQQQSERSITGHTHSDSEGSDDELERGLNRISADSATAYGGERRRMKKHHRMHSSRTSEMDDMTAQMIYKISSNAQQLAPVESKPAQRAIQSCPVVEESPRRGEEGGSDDSDEPEVEQRMYRPSPFALPAKKSSKHK